MNLKGLVLDKSCTQVEGGQLGRRAEKIPGAGSKKRGGVDGGEVVVLIVCSQQQCGMGSWSYQVRCALNCFSSSTPDIFDYCNLGVP